MRRIMVKTSRAYDVLIGSGLLNNCGTLTKKASTAVLVSDDIVDGLYAQKVKASYESAGFKVLQFTFPNGEASKNMQTLTELLTFMSQNAVTRSDIIVALGGGVVGDLAGFAAAIYVRGMAYVQIPTTFLAAIDSSVGGKTAVDLSTGKNMAGAFHQPSLVICDTDTFTTLPDEVFADGIGEAIKYAMIADRSLYDLMLDKRLTASDPRIVDVVETCVSIKRDVVNEDEFDNGLRQILNYGHTAGHAAEGLSGYTITHGRAVSMGMRIIARTSDRLHPDAHILDATEKILNLYSIDAVCPYSPAELAQAALADKKRRADTITLVMLSAVGQAYLKPVSVSELEAYFS